MLNRFKLLVLAIILAILTVLFIQNQELLSLKIFCSDTTSDYCLYQTPSISLAIWMAIFIVLGIFSSLVWQLLKIVANSTTRGSRSSSRSSRTSQTRTSYQEQSNLRKENEFKTRNNSSLGSTNLNKSQVSDWEQLRSEDWEQTNVANFSQDDKPLRSSPDNKRSKSNYVDKFSKDHESNSLNPWESEIRQGRDPSSRASHAQAQGLKENSNSGYSKPKSSVSQETEDVYDANYRTLNNVPPPSIPEDTVAEDEDPDWI